MSHIIALANQKGGVGKTTTTVNLGMALALQKKKVLIIDMDPQGNAGSGVGLEVDTIKHNIYHVLLDETPIDKAIMRTKFDNLDILPSNIDLAGIEFDLKDNNKKEFTLKNQLQTNASLKLEYDFILIDSPPSLGLLTLNTLTASHSVLIPLQCEYFALEGLTQLLRIIQLAQKSLNPKLNILGVLLTMFDSRTKLSSQVVQDVRTNLDCKVFQVLIPRNVKISEAQSYGEPIQCYDQNAMSSISYQKLAKEVLKEYA